MESRGPKTSQATRLGHAVPIKELIRQALLQQGACHLKEIHQAVNAQRGQVPQHTVRARLSELARSQHLEEKLKPLGHGFYALYEEDKNLCSLVSYPHRGPWGDPGYPGNCSGWLVKDLILRLGAKKVLDPAEGSGTVRQVVQGLNHYRGVDIKYHGRDLRQGWDLLRDRMPGQDYDLVWFHPPYWDIIRYSCDPRDLSNCSSLEQYEEKLELACQRLVRALRPGGVLAVLMGDKRRQGRYYCLMRRLLQSTELGQLKAIIIKAQHNCRSSSKNYPRSDPCFIPITHEYCLLFQKPSCKQAQTPPLDRPAQSL